MAQTKKPVYARECALFCSYGWKSERSHKYGKSDFNILSTMHDEHVNSTKFPIYMHNFILIRRVSA